MNVEHNIVSCNLLTHNQEQENLLGKSEPIFMKFSFRLSSLVGVREVVLDGSDDVDNKICTIMLADFHSVSIDIPYEKMLDIWKKYIYYNGK